MTDPINPDHYRSHPSGVECILIAREFSYCLGNVIKYVWRAGLKTRDPLQDLRKAERFLQEEISRLEAQARTIPDPPSAPLGPPPFVATDGRYWNGNCWEEKPPGHPKKQFDNAPRAAHDVPTNSGGRCPECSVELTPGTPPGRCWDCQRQR